VLLERRSCGIYTPLHSSGRAVVIVYRLIGTVASIQIYLGGGGCPSLGGRRSLGRSLRPEGPRAGMEFLGMGQRAPSYQLEGLGERCKLPQRGPKRIPGKFEIWYNLRPQHSHYRTEMPLTTERLKLCGGENILSPRYFYRPFRPQDRRH